MYPEVGDAQVVAIFLLVIAGGIILGTLTGIVTLEIQKLYWIRRWKRRARRRRFK
jgi:hypothetical protein